MIRYFCEIVHYSQFVVNVLQALIADGHDPEEYIFDIDTSDKKTSRTSKSKLNLFFPSVLENLLFGNL